jgi:hypothetical protein
LREEWHAMQLSAACQLDHSLQLHQRADFCLTWLQLRRISAELLSTASSSKGDLKSRYGTPAGVSGLLLWSL